MSTARSHLTYCTNVHPGETWAEVRENLARYVVPVRERFAPSVPFGVGLRLSARAASVLAAPDELAEFRAFLSEHDLYVFTINGFPYGAFHGEPVKERVYLPDWRDPARLAYTNQLADVLAALLPDDVDGTISTLPGAFAPRVRGDEDQREIARAIAAHVAHLVRLRAVSGRHIVLAIEPEPCCFLETAAQTVDFFTRHLFGPESVATLAHEAGLTPAVAEATLREHVGVCFDTCHMAVGFEEPAAALDAFDRAGIRIAKMQVSAGLRVQVGEGDGAARAALASFADDVYLHQVVERRADGTLVRYLDLPHALAALPGTDAREWRIHFHVPLFRERLGKLESTQRYVRDVLQLLRDRPASAVAPCQHFEVETYTWGVLPAEFRDEGIVTAIERELRWTAASLPPA